MGVPRVVVILKTSRAEGSNTSVGKNGKAIGPRIIIYVDKCTYICGVDFNTVSVD